MRPFFSFLFISFHSIWISECKRVLKGSHEIEFSDGCHRKKANNGTRKGEEKKVLIACYQLIFFFFSLLSNPPPSSPPLRNQCQSNQYLQKIFVPIQLLSLSLCLLLFVVVCVTKKFIFFLWFWFYMWIFWLFNMITLLYTVNKWDKIEALNCVYNTVDDNWANIGFHLFFIFCFISSFFLTI